MTTPITPDERIAWRDIATYREGEPYATVIPRLLDALDTAEAEVARRIARPAPAWDEEAVVEAVARRLHADACSEYDYAWESNARTFRDQARELLAAVREHLPVKPDRETVARAIFEAGAAGAAVEFGLDGPVPWSSLDADDVERMCAQADAVLDLWPGESRATAQAEALRDAADEWHAEHYGTRPAAYKFLWDRADRLTAEGGTDRG